MSGTESLQPREWEGEEYGYDGGSESPGELVTTLGQRICISNKSPREADAAGPGPALGEPLL